MGWGGGKTQKEAGSLEKALHFKMGKTYAHLKYPFQHAYLSHVSLLLTEGCKIEIEKDSKGFSLG